MRKLQWCLQPWFPNMKEKQPPDSDLLPKGLFLSCRRCFPIFSFTFPRVFLTWQARGDKGTQTWSLPANSSNRQPVQELPLMSITPRFCYKPKVWYEAFSIIKPQNPWSRTNQKAYVTACGTAQIPSKKALLPLNSCWFVLLSWPHKEERSDRRWL